MPDLQQSTPNRNYRTTKTKHHAYYRSHSLFSCHLLCLFDKSMKYHGCVLFLQSKEKLISSLKEGSGLEVLEGAGAGVELEELRHERELQREEIQKLQAQVQSLRTEIQVHTPNKIPKYTHSNEEFMDIKHTHMQIRAE